MIFGSDNVVGACPQVMDAIVKANLGAEASYGADRWSDQAKRTISEVFECDTEVFFVSTGTIANSLALSALVPPWGSVLCHQDGHIAVDESTAPELLTGGARLIPLGRGTGKLSLATLEEALAYEPHLPHNVAPHALSITQANEWGLVYTPEEVTALAGRAHAAGLKVHMDGARFANAVAALGCTPADITWRAGVDVLCLGASKNGALMAEAVVFFNRELAKDFTFRIKRAGQMAAKGRFFGAQFCGWFEHGLWLELARHANAMASRLAGGLLALPGVRLAWPTQANEVFAILPVSMADALRAAGAGFYEWPAAHLPSGQAPRAGETLVRLVCSFATEPVEVQALLTEAGRRTASVSSPATR